MRKRPWEIILLTVLYAVAPITNVVQASVVNNLHILGRGGVISLLSWNDVAVLVLYPLIAMAIYSVRVAGWWAFMVFNLLLIANNFYSWNLNPNYGLLMVLGCNIAALAASAVILNKQVRAPYFSPRLRWWETEVRYTVRYTLEVPLTVSQGTKSYTGHVLDISRTGCFLDVSETMDIGSPVTIDIDFLGQKVACQGTIVRKSGPKETLVGYGVRFTDLVADSKKSIVSFMDALKKQGASDRNLVIQAVA